MPIERDAHRIALVVQAAAGKTPLRFGPNARRYFPQRKCHGRRFVILPMYTSQPTIHVVQLQRTTVMPQQYQKQYCVSRRAGYGFADLIAAWPGEIATECVVKASRKTAGRN
jgi:hypothetical protein